MCIGGRSERARERERGGCSAPERICRWRVRDPSLRSSSCSCIRGGSGPKSTGSDEQSACGSGRELGRSGRWRPAVTGDGD